MRRQLPAEGPWVGEPDREEWRHPSGLPCLARRGPMGAWCGYVAVPPGHPLHGISYSQCTVGCEDTYCYEHSPDAQIEVHGGLTYSAPCDGEEGVGICHVPEPGESGDVWWFGFDCAHLFDVVPGLGDDLPASFAPPKAEYRDLAYVRSEVNRLAEQLSAMA